jgi:benzoyl-CoA reductase/2-hydroxyglutaryl-CoA dehydratase subunit BcrC/BadD/HgdB
MSDAAPRIGVLCSYVPRELLAAAGFGVQVVSGLGTAGPDAALPANLCPHVRRAAAFFAGPAAATLAGVVVADSCYPMLRLWDHLEASSAPGARWLLRVPRRTTPAAVDFFRGELAHLGDALAAATGLDTLPRERIAAEIDERNHWRERCRRVAATVLDGRTPRLTPASLSLLSGETTAVGEEQPPSVGGRRRPRVMLVGSYFVTAELVALVHDLGGEVRVIESCEHYRLATPSVALEGGADPYRALAAAYLAQPSCPRMERGGERAEEAGRLAEAGLLDGVVYLLMKCCTTHAYAVPRWRRRLAGAGVPLLVLEVEDADWSQPRLVTRLEAFLESLAERAGS